MKPLEDRSAADHDNPTPNLSDVGRRKMSRVELYRDAAGGFRWRYLGANGKTMADSGESYTRKRKCLSAVTSVLGIMTPVGDDSEWFRWFSNEPIAYRDLT